MYPITQQRSVITLIMFQPIPGNIKLLHLLGLAVEVPKLIERRVFCQKLPLGITIFRLQHQRVGGVQRIFVLRVKELVQRPTHIFFVLGQFLAICLSDGCKGS